MQILVGVKYFVRFFYSNGDIGWVDIDYVCFVLCFLVIEDSYVIVCDYFYVF